MAREPFSKRRFTPGLFIKRSADLVWCLGDLVRAVTSRRVGRALGEKIMLAVTQVNDCRYCSYFHAQMALQAGVTGEEVRSLMAGELGGFPPEQAAALAFAQHYAEREGRPDPEAWEALVHCYGLPVARDILAYIRAIMYGNLLGNTLDWLRYKFT